MLNSRFVFLAYLITAACSFNSQANAAAFPQSSSQGSAAKQTPTSQGSGTKQAEDGFVSLLASNDLSKFRGYKSEKISSGWTVTDKVVRFDGVKRSGDIITKDKYKNFDLRFEWKVTEAGNSGVFYHVGLGDSAPYKTGIEYQVLDDKGHKDGKSKLTSAGSIYAMYPPKDYPKKAVGQWNKARIVCNGSKIMHYLNGVMVAEADTMSDDWKQKLAASKFATWERFASQKSGHIGFQDHGDEVWFQNIRIKKLPETMSTSGSESKPAAGSETKSSKGSGSQ